VFTGLADLPYFNPDLDHEPRPAAVSRWRAECQAADGLLIATPEYAHEIPGVLKNALDWLVGSGELYAKPLGVLSASPRPTGGQYVRAALEHTLTTQGARVVVSATVHVPSHSVTAADALHDEQALSQVRAAVASLLEASASACAG
jgi:NAD(P)H-dependent FMN reductase